MRMRYLLVAILAFLLAIVPFASWGLVTFPEEPLPDGGQDPVQPAALTLDHPLPAGDAVRDVQSPLAGWTTLMTQDFEGSFPSTGWTVFDNDGATNNEYYWDDDDYKPHWGSWSAWCANGGADGLDPESWYYPNNAQSWMVYGPFDLSNSSDAELLFYYWNQSESGYDYFWWTASTDDTHFYGHKVSGDSNGWQYVNFDLTNVPTLGDVTGYSSVWIAFVFESDSSNFGDGAFVDDVTLRAYGNAQAVYLPLVMSDQGGFGFQPNPDGYSFPNYGNSHTWQDDLGVADLINMFGASKVCASGSTPADCTLTSSAETWRQQMLNMASGGHCEGMAVTSLRFYEQQAYYTGNTAPGDFQGGAQHTYDLTRDQSIDNYIMYYFALQDVQEVWQPTGQIRVNNTPKQILELARQELESGSDPYTLGIYQYENGSYKWGHGITPYAVEDRGGGDYWLYVYDNNYPNQERHILFDTNADTWTYVTGYGTYYGNASTHSIDLSRISWRNQEPFTPPFNVTASAVEFFTTNGGDILVANAQGQRIGYDPATGRVVNEITGAQIVPLRGVQSPMYRLPVQEAGQLYNVTVSGRAIAGEVSTNLVMVGPGYVVGFEDIRLQPEQVLKMSLSGDGRQLTFEQGQAAHTPNVFMGIDDLE